MTKKLPPSVPWEPIIDEHVRKSPALARGLLDEAVSALLSNETAAARNLIRHVIKGTIGYAELARLTMTPEKSLIRMFGPKGNPTAAKLFSVLEQLQRSTGVRFMVRAVRTKPERGRPAGRTAVARSAARRAA
jgi:DNA-binding phage protein